MERMFKKIFSIAALLSMVAAQANNVTPTLVLRSQGFHGDRQKWVGEVPHINLYDMESWYGTLDVAIGYMRSFRDDRLAFCLFGKDLDCSGSCNNEIKVQGSQVASRDAKAWLADYLYLPCNYSGTFSIDPSIQNVVVDLDFYLGLDEWVNGMYFRIYGPLNWTKWETGFCGDNPTADGTGTATCAAGYFTPSGAETFLTTPAEYFKGTAPAVSEGVTFNALQFAKMPNCDETDFGFADLRAVLGWNFLQDEDYNLGAYVQAAAPTGSKRRASYVLNPVVGNGNHWELGGGVHGHYVFWRSEDEEKHFGFYLDVSLSHLFDAKEQRTFDLKNKDNSRYMLASKFKKLSGTDVPHLVVADSATLAAGAAAPAGSPSPAYVFDNEFTPVANLTTVDLDVNIGIQADVVAMFNFTSRGLSWDLGYNFWGRSCENFDCALACNSCNTVSLTDKTVRWALKGDARVFGFDITDGDGTPTGEAVPLSAIDSSADIHAGSNAGVTNGSRNFGVDNARFAYGSVTSALNNNILSNTPSAQGGVADAAFHIKSSKNTLNLLNTDSYETTATRGISHKVFTHLSYTWDRDNWVPYLGIGGSAEFGQGESCGDCDTECATSCDDTCDDCVSCAVSQWSIWVKGGLSFN